MEYAQIFVDNVFRLHGLPEVIISDRDPCFTGKFWRSLFDLLGTDLRFSTAFHPQTDGQSERMIQMLENFPETVCRETPPNMESVPGISGICSKQRCQRGYMATVHSSSILATTP